MATAKASDDQQPVDADRPGSTGEEPAAAPEVEAEVESRTVGRRLAGWARRWVWLAGPVTVATLPFLVVLVIVIANVGRTGVQRGDYAYIELATRSAMHGHALVGPYSRFGWNHPGPAMFYWNAPFYGAFGQSPESLGVATMVLYALMTATAVVVAGLASGRRAAWISAGAVLTIPLLWGTGWWDGNWNPLLILPVVLATGFLVAGVLAGHRWLVVPLVATSSFAVQTHVGTAPLIALLLVTTVVGIGWSVRTPWRTAWRPWAAPVGSAAGVGLVLWALPIWEQFTNQPGNIGELLQFFRSSNGSHGLREVLDKLSVQLTLSSRNLIPKVASVTTPPPAATPARLALLVALLVAVAVGVFLNRRAGRRFEQHLCTVGLVGAAGVVIAAIRVVGGLQGYLTLSATVVGTLLWAAVALTVAGEVVERAGPRLPRWARGVGVAVVTVASLWICLGIVRSDPEGRLQVPAPPDLAAVSISDQIRVAIPDGTEAVLIEPAVHNGPAASTAAMVANQIELGGFATRSDRKLEHFFGRERRATGCETVAVRIGNVGQPAVPAAGEVIGVFNQQVIQIRDLEPAAGCT